MTIREDLGLSLLIAEPVRPGEDPRAAALRAAARWLDEEGPRRIAVGWGMSLRMLPSLVARRARPETEVREIIGRAPWWDPADGPFDISGALAGRYGGTARVIPTQAFVRSAQEARAELARPDVAEALARAAEAEVILVGPSTADPETSSVILGGGLTREGMVALRARGAVGDIVAQFYAADGRPIPDELDARTIRLSLEQLRAGNVVALATGRARSILGAIRCGLLKGLITDERTAAELRDLVARGASTE